MAKHMAKPTSREYELSAIVMAQDKQIAALNGVVALLKKELESLLDANQYLINQINSSDQK